MRLLARLSLTAAVVLVGYVAVTAVQVYLAAQRDEPRDADAIVVLGAAQYDGRPSPALKGRLDHAVELYANGLAPVVWVTGGRQPGDRFSEASASDVYLQRRGVPQSAMRLEDRGRNTYESLAAAARYLRRREERTVLLVSDPWHAYRIAAIARSQGLRPHVSPTQRGRLSEATLPRLARETLAVSLGRIVGYRRLRALHERLEPPEPVATG